MVTIITLTDDNAISQTIEGSSREEAFKALALELAERNGETQSLNASISRGIVRDTNAAYPHDVRLDDQPALFWETNVGHLLGDNQDYEIVS